VAIELNAASYVTPLASLADAILDTLESIGVGTRL
jgi:two-component system chemotaxis response regulator CheB